ncbi:MAG: alpha/beta fold hydrolase [Thermoguttaceae bacterium]
MKRLSVDGIDFWCEDQAAGLPVLLVHGFPLDHRMWAEQMAALAAPRDSARRSGLRLIAPDLPGFGRSALRADPATMERFADDLAKLLDALDVREPVVFCGLSMGGYIAFEFWRRWPSRLRSLILCDTRAAADAPEVAVGRLTTADRVLREGAGSLVESMLPRVLGETTRRDRPDLVESVRQMMMSNPASGIAAAARGMAQRSEMTGLLAEIRCPTLVVVGTEDLASPPAEVRAMADSIIGAEFVEIPGAGHLAPLENPTAFNRAVVEWAARCG